MHILNEVFPKIYVINLKRCPDRKEHMITQLKGIDFEFTEGIDGRELNEEELISSGIIDKERSVSSMRRVMHMGEAGCALSHQVIYRQMVNNDIDKVLILEDDIIIYRAEIEKHLKNAFSQLPQKWDLCYLGYQRESRLAYSRNLRRAQFHEGTFGYAVSLGGARKILKEHTPVYENADRALIKMCQMSDFSAFAITPQLVEYTNNFKSSVWYD